MADNDKKPRGYVTRVLAADVETSGLAYNCDDPSHNHSTGETYQIVSIGLIVADAQTLKPIDKLYLEIKWDGDSVWSKEAQRVHGLSLEYLEQNGVDDDDAAIQIAELIIKHWGPDSPVTLLGHNVATFDMWFIKRLLRKHDIHVKFGNKHIDTNSVGFSTFETHNSDELFEAVGCPTRDPSAHNALDDAENALKAVTVIRRLFATILNG